MNDTYWQGIMFEVVGDLWRRRKLSGRECGNLSRSIIKPIDKNDMDLDTSVRLEGGLDESK